MKLILVFFIALLSFSIGTYVGKKFTENQYKLSRLEPQDQNQEISTGHERDVASIHSGTLDVKPKQALNDDEIKKLAEEFVVNDDSSKPTNETDKKIDNHNEQNDVAHMKPEDKSLVNKVANRLTAGLAPESTIKPTPNPKSRIPQNLPLEVAASAVGKYTVQIASYPDEVDAEKAAADLKNKGFSAFYITAKIMDKKNKEEKIWYRVSVGLFTTQKEAELYKSDLVARAKVTTAMVQKISK